MNGANICELPVWLLVVFLMLGGTVIVRSHPISPDYIVVLTFWQWSIYRAFRGPLCHVPGPTISKWTNLRLQIAVLSGERVRYVHSLHEVYGRH